MFRDNRYDSYRNDRRSRGTSMKDILNVATIISATVVCIKLLIWGIFSMKTALLVMIGVVVFVAIGNPFAKLALSLIAVYLLLMSQAGFSAEALSAAFTPIFTLLIMLIGLYIILRGLFR